MRIENLKDDVALLSTLARWHRDAWSDLNPGLPLERYVDDLRSRLGTRRIPATFVALRGDVLLGSADLVACDMETRKELTPWLSSVLVAPEHRGRGVGTALVERVVREAAELGFERLHLFTPDREDFYARRGWSILERTDFRGRPVVIMSIPLES